MPVIEREAIVPYSAEQMFVLVDDVEQYPDFVLACSAAEILVPGEDSLQARLTFSKSGISKSFTTKNYRKPYSLIALKLVDGPFKMLEGVWTFTDLDSGKSRVRLDLEFEFDSKVLAMLFGPVFESVAIKLVDTFKARAQEVYSDGYAG